MSTYVAIEAIPDQGQARQEVIDAVQAVFPDWEPAAAGLEDLQTEGFVRLWALLVELVSEMGTAAFRRFGEAIANTPPISATPATVLSSWTMVDDTGGYEIDAGAEVSVPTASGTPQAFRTVEEATVAPGSEAVTILLEAVVPGEEGNGLTGKGSLITPLSFVLDPNGIELLAPSAGGVADEEEDAYFNRLVQTLQLLSLSLIVGRDFEIDARSEPGVASAKAIEAFNAETGEEEALCVSVYPRGADGKTVGSGVKTKLQERQEAKVPSGVLVFVDDPDYTEIDVEAQIVVLPGSDPSVVIEAVEVRLSEYFNPATWGNPTTGDPSTTSWINRDHVYLYEVVSEIDRVAGVDRVVLVKIAKHGSTKKAEDLAISGKVPLTEPGTFTISEA